MYLIDDKIRDLKYVLSLLLQAESIKYSDWDANDDYEELKNQAGVYHFYEISNGKLHSLYLGKAGFGDNLSWNLFKRLNQHFQVSQTNTLLAKYATRNDLTPEDAKNELENSEIFLQWLPIFQKNNENSVDSLLDEYASDDYERVIVWIECFLKSVLQPVYTDA